MVLAHAVAHAPEPDVRPRHVAREEQLEPLRVNVSSKAELACEAPVPEARAAVLGVVLRVVPVALEVVHRRLRGSERPDGRDHGLSSRRGT